MKEKKQVLSIESYNLIPFANTLQPSLTLLARVTSFFSQQHLRHMSSHHREGEKSAIGSCPTCPVWT